jgi:hypothetical protein
MKCKPAVRSSGQRTPDLYAALLEQTSRPLIVREKRRSTGESGFSERHLQCVWFDSSLRPPALVTGDGENVTVCSPGRWNTEAGPDFLDAVLLVGPEKRRLAGDVEIHIHPSDWIHHAHGKDPAYSRVIAHVTYFPGGLSGASLPPGGIHISLRDAIRRNPLFCFDTVDLSAYPYAALQNRRAPCAERLASGTPDHAAELLESAGRERVRRKAARITAAMLDRDAEQVLYEELMTALGYKHNRSQFRRLAGAVPLADLRRECGMIPLHAYAILMGVSGLLPDHIDPAMDNKTRLFLRTCWDFWWKQKSRWDDSCFPGKAWKTAGLRPQNHPARRIAAAAGLACCPLMEQLMAIPANPSTWFRDTERLLTSSSSFDYWNRRLGFRSSQTPKPVALLGKSRIAAILSNILVPFLSATGRDVDPLLSQLPAEDDNIIIRQTAARLFGRDHNPALHSAGIRQQGLLQIFSDFCLQNRSDCSICPLA